MSAPCYQKFVEETTDGTTADVVVPREGLGSSDIANTYVPWLLEVADGGVDDRIGAALDGPGGTCIVQPPAKAGGLDILLQMRQFHSIFAPNIGGNDNLTAYGFTTVPANDTKVVPHTLTRAGVAVVPNLMSAHLRERPTAAVNWAVIAYDDASITFKNWHATEDISVAYFLHYCHSIEAALNSGPIDITLAGAATVTEAHGITDPNTGEGLVPDFFCGFPWDDGGLSEPVGVPILEVGDIDDTNLALTGSGATAAMVFRMFAQYTHSVQQ